MLCLGTGGGITWDSDPDDEWAETELKARRLLPRRVRIVGWLTGRSGSTAALVPADDGHRVDVRPRAHRRRRRVRDASRPSTGVPFAVRRHLDRLRRSAVGLGLARAATTTTSCGPRSTTVLASHADLPLARVRITVTGGAAPLGSERGEAGPTVIVAAGPLAEAAPSTAVCTVPWPRNERGAMAGIKTTSYAENVVALAYARDRGCTEAIFANTTGLLCEGTGSNVFVVVDGRLLTPPLSSGCLAGVTRALVLEVTDAVEEDIPMADVPRRRTRCSSPPPAATSSPSTASTTAPSTFPAPSPRPPRTPSPSSPSPPSTPNATASVRTHVRDAAAVRTNGGYTAPRWTTSPTANVRVAVDGLDDEVAVGGDVDGGALDVVGAEVDPHPAAERGRAGPPGRRAAPARSPATSAVVARSERSSRATSRSSRSTGVAGDVVAGHRDVGQVRRAGRRARRR